MSACVIISVDVANKCIEAAVEIKGSWKFHRIFRAITPDGKPLDLNDRDQIVAYLDKYAQDNFSTTLDAPLLPADDIGGFLERLSNSDQSQRESILGIQASVEDLESLLTLLESYQIAQDQRFSSLVAVVQQDLGTLDREVHGVWWRKLAKLAKWTKANSSLLGGRPWRLRLRE